MTDAKQIPASLVELMEGLGRAAVECRETLGRSATAVRNQALLAAAAQVRLDCGVDAANAVREDRAALIRWLGLPPQTYLDGYLLIGPIERGEHRREGDK